MTELTHALGRESNPQAHRGAVDFSWRALFRRIFPENTAPNVATFARTKVRAAEYLVSGDSEPSGRTLINLLRSPIGDQILNAIARDVEWRALELRLLEIEKLKAELKKREQALSL